jgi:hypothetical protein
MVQVGQSRRLPLGELSPNRSFPRLGLQSLVRKRSIGAVDSPLIPTYAKTIPDLVSDDDDESDASSDPDVSNVPIDKTCDQVRRMIRTLIESSEMKVSDFQRKIGVSSQAYTRFMGQGGRDNGAGCDTYTEAWA